MRFEPVDELVTFLVWFADPSGLGRDVTLVSVAWRSGFYEAELTKLALGEPRPKETVLGPLSIRGGRDNGSSAFFVPVLVRFNKIAASPKSFPESADDGSSTTSPQRRVLAVNFPSYIAPDCFCHLLHYECG